MDVDHANAAGSFGCGGIAFVKAIGRIQRQRPPPAKRSIDLCVGNRCKLSRLTAPEIPGTGKFDYSGTWTTSVADHIDTRDLAFTPGKNPQPLLLATDGGLHKTTDGGLTWHFTGGGTHGYNALQINEVRGQWITSVPGASAPRYDLYFGTQDNGWSTSSNLGAWSIHTSGDVFYIELQHRVATPLTARRPFRSAVHATTGSPRIPFLSETPFGRIPRVRAQVLPKSFANLFTWRRRIPVPFYLGEAWP